MRQKFIAWNGAVPTTGVQVAIALSASSQKTMLQLTASTGQLEIVEWGVKYNGSALAAAVQGELLTTATVAGSSPTPVTPTPWADPNSPASNVTAGFGPTGEGTIATVRMLDADFTQELSGYFKQFPRDERPIVAASQVIRVRVTTPANVSPGCLAYIIWAE